MPDGKKGKTGKDEGVGRDIERLAATPPQPHAGGEKYGHTEKAEDELVIIPRRQSREREQEKKRGDPKAASLTGVRQFLQRYVVVRVAQ